MLKKELIQISSQTNKSNDFNATTREHRVSMISQPLSKESWVMENQQAITMYNQHITDHGAFSDGLRCF